MECEALLAEQYVSAVTGIDGPNGVVLREVADVAVILVEFCTSMQSLDEVVADAVEHVDDLLTCSCHDKHVKNNIDGIGQLDTDLCEIGADNTHRVRNDIHGHALHGAAEELTELVVALLRIHPVVDVACVCLLSGADEGAILDTRNIINRGAEEAVRQKIRVERLESAVLDSLFLKSLGLLLAAVNPNDIVRSGELSHLLDPIVNVTIVSHGNLLSKFDSANMILHNRGKIKPICRFKSEINTVLINCF